MIGFGSIAFRPLPEDKGLWAIFVEDVRTDFCFFSDVRATLPRSDPGRLLGCPREGWRRGVVGGGGPGRPTPRSPFKRRRSVLEAPERPPAAPGGHTGSGEPSKRLFTPRHESSDLRGRTRGSRRKGSLILSAASTATVKRIDPNAVLHRDASGFSSGAHTTCWFNRYGER